MKEMMNLKRIIMNTKNTSKVSNKIIIKMAETNEQINLSKIAMMKNCSNFSHLKKQTKLFILYYLLIILRNLIRSKNLLVL